jgi:hypothetical protein
VITSALTAILTLLLVGLGLSLIVAGITATRPSHHLVQRLKRCALAGVRFCWRVLYQAQADRRGHPWAIGRLLALITIASITAALGSRTNWNRVLLLLTITLSYWCIYHSIKKLHKQKRRLPRRRR